VSGPRSIFSSVTPELEELAKAIGLDPAVLASARAEGVFDGGPEEVARALIVWMRDPVQMVRDLFRVEPDLWQRDALESYWTVDRTALAACKGPGKTAVMAWCGWGSLLLYPHANGIALSITQDNLRDNLWKELAWWYARSPLLQRTFRMGGERIEAREAPKTWWLSARAFAKDARPEQQANTLAGLHSQTHVFVLCDESSDYPPGVMEAAEGIFTNKDVGGLVARLLQAGNCTRQEGPLYDAVVTHRRRWSPPTGNVIHITGDPDDPKRSPRINIEYARSLIREYGREHPMVMVNILGRFPSSSEEKLLTMADVEKAIARVVQPALYRHEAKVMGVDCAAGGLAKTSIALRQGAMVIGTKDWRIADLEEQAEQLGILILKHKPDYVFIDIGGVGRGIRDALKRLGFGEIVIGIDFGSNPSRPEVDDFKRTEMWRLMGEAVKAWLCIPDHPGLRADLVAPKIRLERKGSHTVWRLETKDDMAKRGIPSPDDGDALALTFARPVRPRATNPLAGLALQAHQQSQDYQPAIG
jgi:phage terminase large subunit